MPISFSKDKNGQPLASGKKILFKIKINKTSYSSNLIELRIPKFPLSIQNFTKTYTRQTTSDYYQGNNILATDYFPINASKRIINSQLAILDFLLPTNNNLNYKSGQKITFSNGTGNFAFLNGSTHNRLSTSKDRFSINVAPSLVTSITTNVPVGGLTINVDSQKKDRYIYSIKSSISDLKSNGLICINNADIPTLLENPKKGRVNSAKVYDMIIYAIIIDNTNNSNNTNEKKLLKVGETYPTISISDKNPPAWNDLGNRIIYQTGQSFPDQNQYNIKYELIPPTEFDANKVKIYAAIARYYGNSNFITSEWLEKDKDGNVKWVEVIKK